MKIDFKFPAIVWSRTARMRDNRYFLVLGDMEADLPEYSDADAPMAFKVTDGDQDLLYRYHDGSVYVNRHFGPEAFSPEALSLPLSKGNPLFGSIVREILDESDGKKTHPETLATALSPHSTYSPRALHDELEATMPSILRDVGDYDSDLAFWENKARERLGDLIVVDGEVWEKWAAPCYVVEPTKRRIEVIETGVFASENRRIGKGYAWYRENVEVHMFDQDQLAAAKRYVDECGYEHRADDYDHVSIQVEREIEVLLPQAVTDDIGQLDLDRVARQFLSGVVDNLSHTRLREDGVNHFHAMPGDLLVGLARLRDCLDSYPRAGEVPPELSGILTDLVNACGAAEETWDTVTRNHRTSLWGLSCHIQRWENRGMNLDRDRETALPAPR
jgi:hypothetical protein